VLLLAACGALTACLDIAEATPPAGAAGAIATGGTSASGGGAAGADATAGGTAGSSAGGAEVGGAGGSSGSTPDAGDGGTVTTPFIAADVQSQRSGDSAPNANSITFSATIPATTRFMIACRHIRDNDTTNNYPGTMSVGGQPMPQVDNAARGTSNDNQAGVHCFYKDDPPTGSQPVTFQLQLGNFDYLRISTYYFNRPAQIHAHHIAWHSNGLSHGDSLVTTQPAVVLAIYTKYFTHTVSSAGFTTLFNEPGFGNEAMLYAGVVVQTQPSTVKWTAVWSSQASWGGSQLVAVVPK